MLGNRATNLQIAELLRDVAASYQLKDDNKYKFQIIAYERAADAVEHATSELKDLWDDGKLKDVPGIGPSIAQHLGEIFQNGKSQHFEDLMKGIPKEAFKLMELPGIGIKTALRLITQGKPSEVEKLLDQVKERSKVAKRHLLPYATHVASQIIDWMLTNPKIKRVDPLGSLRRQAATVGDIDLACVTDDGADALNHFTKYPETQKIIEKGEHAASILLPGNVQVDMMVQPEETYGSLLQHFTGSKHHNIAIREYALKKGLSLSEYGIKQLKGKRQEVKAFKTEREFYNYLGFDYIEPELREDSDELDSALNHTLPNLVNLKDIKADLQIHSDFNIETSHDLGESSMEDLVKKGSELGYEYLAFTEHNPSQKGHTDNDIVEILKRKREKVDQLNYSIQEKGIGSVKKVFNSLEIDIKPDGSLPVPETGLNTLDFVLVSLHSSFDLERSIQTKRVLTALAHPKAKIFAHPTGRKLNEREGAELNWPEIFDFCLKRNKWIEINCDPMRLDLPDTLVHEAVKLGVKLTLGTDAHHKDGLNNMVWGVSVARRGWSEKKDIVNTRTLKEFEEMLI
jgi:DNA polymerase (family 10)